MRVDVSRNPFVRIFESVLPTSSIKRRNPLFDYQLSRLRWPEGHGRNAASAKLRILKDYTVNWGCAIPAISAIIFVVLIFGSRSFLAGTLPFLLLLGFTANSLFSNIGYALAAINTITPQIVGAQWEPLRLTELSESEILQANHAIIQIRVWQAVIRDVGIRSFVGLSGLPLLAYILFTNFSDQYHTLSSYTGESLRTLYLLLFLIVLIYTIGFSLELIWRMRTVTLLGMILAAWTRNFGTALLLSFVGTLALLLMEMIGVFGLSTLAASFTTSLSYRYSSYSQTGDTLAAAMFLICAVLINIGLYLFFKAINAVLFWQLKRVAFRE